MERFYFYHPQMTYMGGRTGCFVRPDGAVIECVSDDMQALYDLGKKIFDSMNAGFTRKEFDEQITLFDETIREFSLAIKAISVEKNLQFHLQGETIECPDFEELGDENVLSIYWQLLNAKVGDSSKVTDDSVATLIGAMFLLHALHLIDSALVSLSLREQGAVALSIEASEAFANTMVLISGNEQAIKARKEMGFNAAIARLRNDPKQAEKSFVRECWKGWRNEPTRYSSKAAFARDMLEKCEHLSSQKKIEDWCRDWEKCNQTG